MKTFLTTALYTTLLFVSFCGLITAQVYDSNLLNKYKDYSSQSYVITRDEFGIVFSGDEDITINGNTAQIFRSGRTSSNQYYSFYSWDFNYSTNDGNNDESYTLTHYKWHRIGLPGNNYVYFKALSGYQDVIIYEDGSVLDPGFGNVNEVYMQSTCPPVSSIMSSGTGILMWTHDLYNLTTINYQIYYSSNQVNFTYLATVTNSLVYQVPQSGYYRIVANLDGKYSAASTAIYISSNQLKTANDNEKKNFTFNLANNYPNPFNPSTNISFTIPTDGYTSLKIYDISGSEIATLVNEYKTAGEYSVSYNAGNIASGVYLYRLESGNKVITKRMNLVK